MCKLKLKNYLICVKKICVFKNTFFILYFWLSLFIKRYVFVFGFFLSLFNYKVMANNSNEYDTTIFTLPSHKKLSFKFD